jgi:tetratricopeptide (TPR) repeat protein
LSHPDDRWINNSLAYWLGQGPRPQWGESTRFLTAALARRPDNPFLWYNLGRALYEQGSIDLAIVATRKAIQLQPQHPLAHVNLGACLAKQKKRAAAIASFRDAIRLKNDIAEAHFNLGTELCYSGKLAAATASLEEAIRLKPDFAAAYNNLALVQREKGDLDAALRNVKEALRLDRALAASHDNLSFILAGKGDLDGAVAAQREAVRLRPTAVQFHQYGIILSQRGDLAESEAALRKAVALEPDLHLAHYNLGLTLSSLGKKEEALAEFRETTRLDSSFAEGHYMLGAVLGHKGYWEEARRAYEEAIRRRPAYAKAHCNLGESLMNMGRFTEALVSYRRGHALGLKDPKWNFPSRHWIRHCERLIAFDKRLPGVLRGEDKPASVAERLQFARVCMFKGQYTLTARFHEEAFATNPELANDQFWNCYNAACAAAMAGCGQGDAREVDEKGRAHWRKQALAWLRAELTRWITYLANPQAKTQLARDTLRQWQRDFYLARVRDDAALDTLPDTEQEAWRRLWADVAKTLRKLPAARPAHQK